MISFCKAAFQSIKECVYNSYGPVAFGAAFGAGALIATLVYRTEFWKGRKMSSFPNLSNNITVMGRRLTPDIFAQVKDLKTTRRYNLDDLIEAGLAFHINDATSTNLVRVTKNPSGLLAGDEDCYMVFSPLVDPVICELHEIKRNVFGATVNMDWTEIKGGRFYGAEVVSCRLSTSRNIRGFRLIPGCSGPELETISNLVIKALQSLKGDLLPQQQHVLRFRSAFSFVPEYFPQQLLRDWSKGRLVWWTADRGYRVFVNWWDHMKIVVTQPGGDLLLAFKCLCKLLKGLEERLAMEGKKFMWSRKYGFITSSPEDIGTGLRVEVKVRLAKLVQDARLPRIIDVLPVNLIRGVDPENRSIVCITNRHKMNLSEVEIVQQVVNSVVLLLEINKRLQRGENFKDLLP